MDLVRRCADGDLIAARCLHAQYSRRLFRLAYLRLHNASEAKRATHNTFVHAFDHLYQFDPDRQSLSDWLGLTLVRECRPRSLWVGTLHSKQQQAHDRETLRALEAALAGSPEGRATRAIPFSRRQSWEALPERIRISPRGSRTDAWLHSRVPPILALLMILLLVWMWVQNSVRAVEDVVLAPQVAQAAAPATAIIASTPLAPSPTPAQVVASPLDVPTPARAARPGIGRVTILIAGGDRRPGETGVGLTDALMLLSLDRAHHSAVVLSIPRDLWVQIPGRGAGRINTAYAAGEASGHAGAALLAQTVNDALGVHVDHVVRVEFGTVITFIDAVGGVDINVAAPIDDPLYPNFTYGYDPLYIPAGRQHMDGALALKYMRSRHASSDLDRAARQQQVLVAVREKLVQPGTWPGFIDKLPELVWQLHTGISSDLSLADIIQLSEEASNVPEDRIQMAVLDWRFVTSYVMPDGAQVLLPQQGRIQTFVGGLLGTATPAPARAEMARVRIVAGNAQVAQAPAVAAWLRRQGFNMVDVAAQPSKSNPERTTIVDHAGRPATVQALASLLDVAPGDVLFDPNPTAPAEIEILLGSNFTLPALAQKDALASLQ